MQNSLKSHGQQYNKPAFSAASKLLKLKSKVC